MKKQLPEVLLETKLNLYLPDDVLIKIWKLCNYIHAVEWSGILLYTTEGTLSDPQNFKIHVKDIIPMHKGTGVATGFNYNEKKRDNSGIQDRHIDYVIENEEAETWRLGLIHSHNNMNTYFSSVDLDELQENTPTYINFLSLIVNNRNDFEARLAFVGEAEGEVETSYTALDENGNSYTMSPAKIRAKIQKLFMYQCEIHSNKTTLENPFNNLFDLQVRSIIEDADRPAYAPPKPTQPYTQQGRNFNTVSQRTSPIPGFKNTTHYPITIPAESTNQDLFEDQTFQADIFSEDVLLLIRLFFTRDMLDETETIEVLINKFDYTGLEEGTISNFLIGQTNGKETDDQLNLLEESAELLEFFEAEIPFLTTEIIALRYKTEELLAILDTEL